MTNKSREKIGLLGGSFDPIHFGHLGLAKDVRKTLNLHRTLLIPANIPPHKQNNSQTNSYHRLRMLKLAIEGEKNLAVSEIELERGGVSYTIETLIALQLVYPKADFTLTLGMDAFLDLETWRNWKEILKQCHIAVAIRPSVAITPLSITLERLYCGSSPYEKTVLKNCPEAYFRNDLQRYIAVFCPRPRKVSSSEIRHILSENRMVKNLLPPKVEKYIITNRLYQVSSRPCME